MHMYMHTYMHTYGTVQMQCHTCLYESVAVFTDEMGVVPILSASAMLHLSSTSFNAYMHTHS